MIANKYSSRLWMFVSIVLIALWGGAALFYGQQLSEKRDSARSVAANHGLLLEEFVGRYLQAASASLSNIARTVAVTNTEPTPDIVINNALLSSHDRFYLTLMDSKGFAVATTLPGMDLSKKPNYAYREYFKYHASHQDKELLVGGPLVGRLTGIKFFSLSRRISAPDGRFLGVIIGLVDSGYIAEYFRAHALGRRGIATLTHALEKKTLAELPNFEETYGRDVSKSMLFKADFETTPVGFFESSGQVDGVPRTFAYRKVGDYPLVVAVGIASEDLTAPIFESMKFVVLGLVVITALILVGAYLNLRFQRAMVKAIDDAEAANEAKSQFLSSMSHELRTPLNAILGFSQLMQFDPNLDSESKDNINEVVKSGEHLLELINEILDLSKIESGHIDLSLETVSVHRIAQECLQRMQPVAGRNNISLGLSKLEGLFIQCDRLRLLQVFLNLVSNAIKYNRESGSVWIEGEKRGDEWVRITVADTGRGIPEKQMANLFQPFNRLGAETTGIEGTGIGLSITKRLVNLMGGTIGAESKAGIGSTFFIELPAATPV